MSATEVSMDSVLELIRQMQGQESESGKARVVRSLSDLPPEAREELEKAVASGEVPREIYEVLKAADETRADGLVRQVAAIMGLLSDLRETLEILSKGESALVDVQHKIRRREAIVFKQMLDDGVLGKNQTERDINMEHARFSDEVLAGFYEQIRELESAIKAIDLIRDAESRSLHTALSTSQMLARLVELDNAEAEVENLTE